ncbi:MAG TPA: cytochrome c3 family protein [Gemmatimonadaceae bacterium]|nr:cytochrome c3 family protein [Gemmatimonadaceae bacterium]
MRSSRIYLLGLAALGAAAFTAGCTSEKVVYKSGTDFAAPPAAAASFVGYYDETNKQTVCGSCHVDFQVRWASTKHASAWADLQASGHATGTCEACHTVNDKGNIVADTSVGYRTTKASRYHDVQCESCHGPGLTHASGPNSGNRPLASIRADTNITIGCGECHTGVHEPFVDEWKKSGHATTWEASHSSTDPYCQSCHTGQGALAAWGVNHNYIEKADAAKQPATCAVCHDPHGSDNDHQLRYSLSSASLSDNLCVKCHQRNATVADVTQPGSTRNSAHSPEGPTLFGNAGWFPPGMAASDSIIATHGTPSKNPKLCATCHVQAYSGTDPATGAQVFSTGHRFLATPCVGTNGLPTDSQTCDVSAQTFRSCIATGCHGTETAARSAFNTAQARITLLVGQANALVASAKLGPKKAECTFSTTVAYTTCMGTQFNVSVANKPGSFVHNPFLVEQLLIASINQMKKDYNLTASLTAAQLTPMFKKGQVIGEGGR